MAANKYIALIAGKLKEVFGQVTSAGAGDANKLVALGTDGLLDPSLMPVGIGAEVTVAVSFENLTAGDFVNLFLSGGVIKVRKADATDNSKPAHGFVLANVTAPANATVYRVSQTNTGLTGLTVGSEYYLTTTPGALSATPPSAAGNIVQPIGIAHIATAIVMDNQKFFVEVA